MKVCCVFNYNPLYRKPIYSAMDREFDCDFYFGDKVFPPIESFDAKDLKGFKGFLKAKKIGRLIWYSGIGKIFTRKYTHYIVTGDISIILIWLIIYFAKITNRKVYLWTHGLTHRNQSPIEKCILNMFFAKSTGILMYNKHFCENMLNIGCKRENLHVFHNSLNTSMQSDIYSRLQLTNVYKEYFKNDLPTILYIGRIQKHKRVDLLIEAMHLLQNKGIDLNLVIIGSNVDDDFLEIKIKEYDMCNRVWMYGPCFDEDKNAELIYNANVCVSPGNVGLTAIHVLSYGTPVITHNNFRKQMPEFEAIIHNKTGAFFQENDVHDLADSIQRWVFISDEERTECRRLARETIVNEWSVDFQLKLLKDILK